MFAASKHHPLALEIKMFYKTVTIVNSLVQADKTPAKAKLQDTPTPVHRCSWPFQSNKLGPAPNL